MKKKSPNNKKSGTIDFLLSKKVGKAIMDYGMLDDNDTIVVAVSGGKDSMVLLNILAERRSFVPINYDIVAVYVDMGYRKSHVHQMERYFKENNFRYCIKKTNIAQETPKEKMNCFWCSWNRRKILFNTAKELGCTKIALGHHKDDIVQTFMLNLIFQGEISAMSPRQELFDGELIIIRPLAYIEERETARYAHDHAFKVSRCGCAHAGLTQRHNVARIIKKIEKLSPYFKTNVFRSLSRIKREYLV